MTSSSSILSLSNLILLHIITDIEDNVDIICLLLTCKKLYHYNSLKKLIQFKGIGTPIDLIDGYLSTRLETTFNQFKLLSFKDILVNSISDQCVIVPWSGTFDYFSQWLQQRISAENIPDKSRITTILVHNYQKSSLKPIADMPSSIETLFIRHPYDPDQEVVDLGSISFLSNLQRLEVWADIVTTYAVGELGLYKFVSLTELAFKNHWVSGVGPGLLPSSLTSLSLRTKEVPPPNTFLSLTSLFNLEIFVSRTLAERNGQYPLVINLESLCTLKKLKIEHGAMTDSQYKVEVTVPPSIEILTLFSDYVQIPHRCTMPLLERLYVRYVSLVEGDISLLLCPSIKKLAILRSFETIPKWLASTIPSTLEKLAIIECKLGKDILGEQFVFPPSLTHLSMDGDYEPVQLPPSLVKLEQTFNKDAAASFDKLRHLKKLVWLEKDSNPVPPYSYPPNLETINLYLSKSFAIDDIPPTIKYLFMILVPDEKPVKLFKRFTIFSISFIIPKNIQQQQLWLPQNTTHLTLQICNQPQVAFRLDEIINHTNVRYLTLQMKAFQISNVLKFTIQRLDPDNKNVLVLETQSLLGGIITQQRKSINTQQQYDPIYLYFHSSMPFLFHLNTTTE
ncbi:hypothetical protein DFA_02454 [Cavenderia fasciculata]|uniref:Uncharacterized protein n=1 Tax=Cavenderia fasciculata TaxID=261658 RepID=F4PZH7_CACFS|nr:uncharacterized protein DFA_02454 [Cavenderia fasciculata]EGG19206.1 hypothetical protein DFA_02454 [Cavenderia fasciculata]|eukprot:XP_004366839.1 hypothetical protein DFA_02454 [Cavenderia fasciculata]